MIFLVFLAAIGMLVVATFMFVIAAAKGHGRRAWPTLVPVIIIAVPVVAPVLRNNRQVARFARRVAAYPLPPQTEAIDIRTAVGLLHGNGNHCDFEVQITLVSALDESELSRHFAEVEFPPVRAGKQSRDDRYASRIHTNVRPSLAWVRVRDDGRSEYALSVVDGGYPPGFDFRCH